MSDLQCGCVLIINDDGHVLATSRRYNHNLWGLPGGKIDDGKDGDLATDLEGTIRRGTVREAYEETGVRIPPDKLRLLHVAPLTDEANGRRTVVWTYYVNIKDVTFDINIPNIPNGDKPAPVPTDPTLTMGWNTKSAVTNGPFRAYNSRVMKIAQDIGLI